MATAPREKLNETADAPKNEAQEVDLHNPTRAIRVLYDGIEGSMKTYNVPPGGTTRGCKLSPAIIDELKARTKARGKERSDLIVLKPGATPPAPKETPTPDEDVDDGE